MTDISRVTDNVWKFKGRWNERLSDLLDARCVRLELKARKKEDAIRELVELLADAGKLEGDAERYVGEIMAREKISSTGIGGGIAIPHRLIADVSGMMMAVGRSEKGVSFDSVDGKPAHLVFLIISAQGRNAEHLKILSKLSRLLNDRSFFDALMRIQSGEDMVEMFKAREPG
jgi:fructose-specific phosphotransferase system IIA component